MIKYLMCRPIEAGLEYRCLVAGFESKQAAIVHSCWPDNLARVDPGIINDLASFSLGGFGVGAITVPTWPIFDDTDRAVEIAEAVAQKGGQPSAGELDTLGAAYAEAGRFDDAIVAAESALVFAKQAGDRQLEDQIRGRLAGYRLRRPYHAPLGR